MRQPLWVPSEEQLRDANLTRFIGYVNKAFALDCRSYSDLYKWSVTNASDFWAAVWDYSGIVSSRRFDKVVDDLARFPGAHWFPGARLNFAENLLKHSGDKTALVSRSESHPAKRLTYSQLRHEVARFASGLREMGVRAGDRVAGFMPNIPETTIAMLATTTLGGVWACCGAELGPTAVLERLGQIGPKVLVAADGYIYKGRRFDILPSVERVATGISSIKNTIIAPFLGTMPASEAIPNSVLFDELSSTSSRNIEFAQLPADHPVYVMFTSGTTGQPKCMVQSAAGILVNHLKELMFHADLKKSDVITYITSPSWMMWTWLMSGLALGVSIVLYEGNPNHPDWGTMWRLVE
ncbi:MAG TPA: AMP-binding protein, partial [Candidatus Bathyarchaeia archaeon]|nr:AMP-binding protein [Candidatus Bathyarchaeia archaeon]